jgi:hypothetical protein
MSICRYAVGSKRFDELNLLLHVAVAGGALCGLVAFALMAVVVYVPVLAAAVLDPSAVSNKALSGECALIPTTEQLLENANMYWLLITASWFPKFILNGLYGFLAGTGSTTAYLAPLVPPLALCPPR